MSHFSFHLSLSLSRCYNKTNGTFSSGTLPVMHRVAPCQQDGLEMVPLGQVSSQCHGLDSHVHSGDQGADAGCLPDEHSESSTSQHSCCLVGDNENCTADNTGETHFIPNANSISVCFLSFCLLTTEAQNCNSTPPVLFYNFRPVLLIKTSINSIIMK